MLLYRGLLGFVVPPAEMILAGGTSACVGPGHEEPSSSWGGQEEGQWQVAGRKAGGGSGGGIAESPAPSEPCRRGHGCSTQLLEPGAVTPIPPLSPEMALPIC